MMEKELQDEEKNKKRGEKQREDTVRKNKRQEAE